MTTRTLLPLCAALALLVTACNPRGDKPKPNTPPGNAAPAAVTPDMPSDTTSGNVESSVGGTPETTPGGTAGDTAPVPGTAPSPQQDPAPPSRQ